MNLGYTVGGHTPAAERKIGFTAYKYYAAGLLVSLIYIYFISVPMLGKYFTELEHIGKRPPAQSLNLEERKEPELHIEENSPEGREARAADLYPFPPKPEILFRDYKPAVTDPTELRDLQNLIFAWEKRTGKRFLTDHNSMKTVNKTRFDYIHKKVINKETGRISDPKGSMVIEPIEPIRSIDKINADRPQLFRVDYERTVDQLFFYDREMNRETRKEVFRSYKGTGLCYGKPSRYFDNSKDAVYKRFSIPYICGQVWRDFVTAIYYAKSDEELLKNDYYNLTKTKSYQVEQGAQKSYLSAKQEVYDKRWAYISAEIEKNGAGRWNWLKSTKEKPAILTNQPEKETPLTSKQQKAQLVASLSGGVVILLMFVLMGTKYGIIRKPRIIPNHYYLLSLPFFGAYLYYLNLYNTPWLPSFLVVFGAVVVPFLIFIFDISCLVISEVWKEHQLYERWTKTFSGVASARWGGILNNWKFDITNIFDGSRGGRIKKTKYSPVFIGQILLEYDHMVFNRFIGTSSEQHLITVAGTGAGKSRDAINANLLSYCGGIVALDIKGELTRLSYKRRSEYAPCYVVDPYNIVGGGIPIHQWNPLNEIDPNSPSTKDDLERIAEALIWKEKGSKENEHFVDIPKLLLVGFMAHVLSTYPEDERDLPTVFDLIKERSPEVQLDMLNNEAIGGAPREAALEIKRFSERAASEHGSTLMRGVKWINTEIRPSLTGRSSFSLKDCKTKDATVFFVIREDRLHQMKRYIRLFYALAYDRMNENITPRQEGSKRQVLMLMDEFASLDYFKVVEDGFNRGRGSMFKFWIVLQNYSQLADNYSNPKNFTSNADMQVFGIAPTDDTFKSMIEKALGEYEDSTEKDLNGNNKIKSLMDISAINSFLDAGKQGQIFIPLQGDNMRLNRVKFMKLFNKKYYGSR